MIEGAGERCWASCLPCKPQPAGDDFVIQKLSVCDGGKTREGGAGGWIRAAFTCLPRVVHSSTALGGRVEAARRGEMAAPPPQTGRKARAEGLRGRGGVA